MEARDSQGLKLPLKSGQIVTLVTLVLSQKGLTFIALSFFALNSKLVHSLPGTQTLLSR